MRKSEPTLCDTYVESLYPQEDDGLRSIRSRLEVAGRWGVNIGAGEGRMLQVLARTVQARKIVEIGALYGYSAVWLARALPDDGHLHTIERDALAASEARRSFDECGVAGKVTLHEGEAIDILQRLRALAPFDLVFIDANKSAYPEYLTWVEHAVRVGGLIIADNTLLGGHACSPAKPESMSLNQWAGIREFNSRLADNSKFISTIFPTSEGLSIALKIK